MAQKEEEKPRKRFNILDTWDGEYRGNEFGDKVAVRGGIFLLIVLLFMIYRHYSMGVPFGGEAKPPVEQVETPVKE